MRAVARAAYARYIPRIGRAPAPMTADFLGHVTRNEAHVLESDGAIAGFIISVAQDGHWFVENVAVSPAHQGLGAGRRLMDFAEDRARENGCAYVTLYTNVRMTENRAFYAKLGFKRTHFTREQGFRRVYLAKEVCLS